MPLEQFERRSNTSSLQETDSVASYLTLAEREYLRAQITHAAEAIPPNWPIKTFISRSPLSGFEHMNFDMGVRRAQELMGGKGYLPKQEYRQAYARNRITYAGLKRALEKIWLSNGDKASVTIGNRQVHASDILLLHLIHGIDGMIPQLYHWKIHQEDATQKFRSDVPSEIQQRVTFQAQKRLQESLFQIGSQLTISEWVYQYTGLNLPGFIHDLLYKEIKSPSRPETDNTSKFHHLLSSLGLLPPQFDGYRHCLTNQFQIFQADYQIDSLAFSEYQDRWLSYERAALPNVVSYLCGSPGNLKTLQKYAQQHPGRLHLKCLWAHVLRTFGLVDPELPEQLGDLLTKPASSKIGTGKEPPSPLSLGFIHSMSFWVSRLSNEDVVEQINEQMIRWCGAFLDEGLSSWSMPEREKGFYRAWRELATRDYSGWFLGNPEIYRRIQSLPDQPEDALATSLNRMGIPKDQWEEYFTRHFAHLPGWVGIIRWRSNEPEYPWQKHHPIDPVEYLTVRLFYEAEFVARVCQREWGIEGSLPALEGYFQFYSRALQVSLGQVDPHANENLDQVCRNAWRLFELAQFLELYPEDIQQLSGADIQMLFEWLDGFPEDRQGLIWQEAYEEHYRQLLISQLSSSQNSTQIESGTLSPEAERPQAQTVFCIDVRSEPFRRHLEAQGHYDTIGFAGFFAIPICYRPMGSEEDQLLCPVLIKPKNVVRESPRKGNIETLRQFDRGLKWNHLGHHLFHDLKSHPIASLMLIDVLGGLYALTLLGKTTVPALYRRLTDRVKQWLSPPVPSRIPVEKLSEKEADSRQAKEERKQLNHFLTHSPAWRHLAHEWTPETIEALRQAAITPTPRGKPEAAEVLHSSLGNNLGISGEQVKVLLKDIREELGLTAEARLAQLDWVSTQGFTPTEQIFNVERSLRVMSLTRNFARLVLLCGHGSTTENNPYASGYDCGACGGNHGGPNARVLAAMANKPEVREELKNRGIEIPHDTWFLPGEHNTTIDQVALFDLDEVPETHKPDVIRLTADLDRAGLALAQERCRRLPGAPQDLPPFSSRAHTAQRSVDWSQVRPEWGLSRNAAFIIAKRSLTKGINLEGRTFLHNYNAEDDESGKVLEIIMTAPLVVAEWINLQYYFSAVDPWVYGSGSKVLHNLVSGIGVMLGAHSDFQTGLPLQTVRDGANLFHEPLRLLVIIQAPMNRISDIIQRHTILQYFFNNQWIHLVALDPATGKFHQYCPGGTWQDFLFHPHERLGGHI